MLQYIQSIPLISYVLLVEEQRYLFSLRLLLVLCDLLEGMDIKNCVFLTVNIFPSFSDAFVGVRVQETIA